MSEATDFAWLQHAAEGLGEVERGLRRNLLRSSHSMPSPPRSNGLLKSGCLLAATQSTAQIIVIPCRCDTVTLSSHLWTH